MAKIIGHTNLDLHVMKEDGMTYAEIADHVDKSIGYVQYRIKQYRAGNMVSENDEEQRSDENFEGTTTLKEDGSIYQDRLIKMSEEDKRSPRRMLELHKLDPDLWVLTNVRNNLWHMKTASDDPMPRIMLYQSRLNAKPRIEKSVTLKDLDEFFSKLKSYTPVKVKKIINKGIKTLVVAVGDTHFGNDVYDEMTIDEKFQYTANRIIAKVANSGLISEVIIAALGDIGHWDGVKANTTGGTRLETDGSIFQVMFDRAFKAFTYLIDGLVAVGVKVKLPYIGGNHDEAFGWFLIKSLEYYYKDNDMVEVDSGPETRKVVVIGKTLLGLTHGNMSKKNQKSWMLSYREEIGQTTWSEVLQGHLHHTIVQEENGMIIRNVPAMAGTDKWHYDKGFVGASRATECFLYDWEDGLEETWRISA